MLQAFVITLREGLEAFLIVAISLAYLRKTGRSSLIPAVHWGIAASIARQRRSPACCWPRAANQALWEGVLALVAAALVGSLIVHMWRAGRHMKRNIEGRLEASSMKTGSAAFLGVFGFTLLMITREGMETALLMNALLFQLAVVRHPQRRGCRHARRRRHRLAVDALRPPRQPGAVLPGHRRLPRRLRRAARHLRRPRADRSQHLPRQPAVARRHRAVRSGRHLRSVPRPTCSSPCRSHGCSSRNAFARPRTSSARRQRRLSRLRCRDAGLGTRASQRRCVA